jgi:hypothetical protein
VEELELSYVAGGKVQWHNHFGKQFGGFLNIQPGDVAK